MDIKGRVNQWIEEQKKRGITQTKLANYWGVKGQYVSSLKTGEGSVGFEVVKRILDFDKAINARWLINGEGEMYFSNANYLSEPSQSYQIKEEQDSDLIRDLINELRKQLKEKEGQIKFLQKVIEEKL